MLAQNNFITYILVLFQRQAQKMNLHDDLYPGVISKMATRLKQENYDDIHLPASFKIACDMAAEDNFHDRHSCIYLRIHMKWPLKKLVNDMPLGAIF